MSEPNELSRRIAELASDERKKIPDLETPEIATERQTHTSDILQANLMNFDILKAKFLDLKQNREQRKEYAHKIFLLLCVWLGIIMIIIVLQGMGVFSLNDSVLITLITTTTANIAAYFLVVTRYLFPNNNSDKKGEN